MKVPLASIRNWVRPKRYAWETGTPYETLRWWWNTGQITYAKVGRPVYLDRDELNRRINKNVVPTVEESVQATLRRWA